MFTNAEIDTNRDFSQEFFNYIREGPRELKGKLDVETIPRSVLQEQNCMQCDEIELWMIRIKDDEDDDMRSCLHTK